MPQKQSKKLALLQRRQQVAELALQGWSQAKIAEHLNVAQGTISGDLTAIRKEWRESALRDFDEARAIELQKLNLIETEAWSAWKRSQKPQQSAVFTGASPGPESRKSLANRYGDPRFLDLINKCIAARRALCGLDVAPVNTSGEDLFDGNVTQAVRVEHVLALLASFGQRAGVAFPGTAIIGPQPRDVRAGGQQGELEDGPASGTAGPDADPIP